MQRVHFVSWTNNGTEGTIMLHCQICSGLLPVRSKKPANTWCWHLGAEQHFRVFTTFVILPMVVQGNSIVFQEICYLPWSCTAPSLNGLLARFGTVRYAIAATTKAMTNEPTTCLLARIGCFLLKFSSRLYHHHPLKLTTNSCLVVNYIMNSCVPIRQSIEPQYCWYKHNVSM